MVTLAGGVADKGEDEEAGGDGAAETAKEPLPRTPTSFRRRRVCRC